MPSQRVLLFVVALSLVFLAVPLAVIAQQVSTGTVTGVVTDPSGAVIAGADVTLTDITTHASRHLVTNSDGRYFFVNIPPGTYDLTVNKTGFRSEKVSKQAVNVGLTLTLNLRLQVGVASEVVEVKASTGSELQTLNATVGTAFDQVSIDSLPAISRETSEFVVLQPGVAPQGAVAGAVYDQNTFQLDGGQNTNDMDGEMESYTIGYVTSDPSGGLNGVPTGVMPTPLDSIEEFKVSTTQQTADFNSSAGAQVSMVTRRGHDAWHGTVYEYYLDNDWNANTFTNNAPQSPPCHSSTGAGVPCIPDYHYNRFGAAGGGPIIPKKILGGKTYFFGNYEGFRYPNVTTVDRETPGPGMREGLLVSGMTVYNLNPTAVTYNGPALTGLVPGVQYQPGASPSATGVAAANCVTAIAGASCDPRNLGISPTIAALWGQMPPAPASSYNSCPLGGICDGINVLEVAAGARLPEKSDFAVARIDHDFGEKEHFFSTYRFYRLALTTAVQTTLEPNGTIVADANRPQVPWFFATGLTSNITSNFTNQFNYSYLRNFWLWADLGGPPQTCGGNAACAGLVGALEPSGETADPLAPTNVNTQSTRQRYWDGQDHMLRDDMTRLLGKHVLQWGGIYQHNYNQHSRNDNGGGIDEYQVNILGNSSTITNMAGYVPTLGSTGITTGLHWDELYGDTLGILTTDQIVYARSGPQLSLLPPLSPVEDRVHIPYYNVYFTDSWHIKPTVTLTYGLAWTLEMPPTEEDGKQMILVDAANQELNTQDYFNTRKAQALLGQSYNPELGWSLVGNAAGGLKYPYNPYYGSFSPRLAVAWSPNYDNGILGHVVGRSKTVIRGGFSIIYGRLNGVDLVLVPLIGTGLLQPVQCFNPTLLAATPANVGCGTTSASTGIVNPSNAFRIGPCGTGCGTAGNWDGLNPPLAQASTTLPQPYFPGVSQVTLPNGAVVTSPEAAASEASDVNFRPNKSYEVNFTIQRQVGSKWTVEAGYIGRVIRNEYLPIDLNTVPYMYTLNGQSFAKAYAALEMEYCGGLAGLAGGTAGPFGGCNKSPAAVTPQPFFEAALGGTGSAYCTGFSSCTAALAAKQSANLSEQYVWSLWSALDNGAFVFPHTMQQTGPAPETAGYADNTSLGFGNYNAFFLSSRTSDWHGLTAQSNLTYGKALGTGALAQVSSEYTAVDPFYLSRGYGPQSWDRKFVFNTFLVYQPPYYRSQHGVAGHLLGGWTIAPILSTGSGLALPVQPISGQSSPYYGGQAFGQADASNYGSSEQAVLDLAGPGCSFSNSTSRHNNVLPVNGVATSSYHVNLYANPTAMLDCFRDPILGYDNGHNGGYGGNILRGQPYWNVDMQIRKTTNITERISGEFQVVFANLFNHDQLSNPTDTLYEPTVFGSLTSQADNPRKFEFGFRARF